MATFTPRDHGALHTSNELNRLSLVPDRLVHRLHSTRIPSANDGEKEEVIVGCHEQRVSGLMQRLDARALNYLHLVPLKTIYKFTLLQIAILAVIFTITLVPYIDALFPLCIAILVPLRTYKLPEWFGFEHTNTMDARTLAPPE
ncbi:MAG: hypothetical protein SGPRY_006281, partial [Prymnesium sp.]